MTWRKSTTEEIEELRQFVDGMKRGQTLATGDSLLESLRQIHDRREAPNVSHDHKGMLRDRLMRQMARSNGEGEAEPLVFTVIEMPPLRREVLRWAVAASIILHVVLGAVVLPNVDLDIVRMAGITRDEAVETREPDLTPLFITLPSDPRPAQVASAPSNRGVEDGVVAEAMPLRSTEPARFVPLGRPVAPEAVPIVNRFSDGVDMMADQNLASGGDVALGGPPVDERMRPFSEVSPGRYDAAGDAASPGISSPVKFHNRPKPFYPSKALENQITGTVKLSVVFGADGRIGNIRIVRSVGWGCDEAAIEAVRNMKFTPAMKDGRPKAATIEVEVEFGLR